MWDVFTVLGTNVGLRFEDTVLLVVVFLGLVFYARDFKLGVIMHMFASVLCFIWFYSAGLIYKNALAATMIFFVMMCLTLYATSKQTQARGLIG